MSTSAGKTLSNGTLSLRFMQNASRAKQQAAIDLERAKVKDDAEWEVPQEIREAWGLSSSSQAQTKQAVAHETSYLPFLFPSLQASGPSMNDENAAQPSSSSSISGRRTFARGREVRHTSSSADGPAKSDVKQEINERESSQNPIGQPKAPYISGAGPLTKTRAHRMAELDRAGLLPAGQNTASEVPVLSMISEETSAVVGMDIRQMRKLKEREAVVTRVDDTAPPVADANKVTSNAGKGPLSFLRPAGIDSPASGTLEGKKKKKRPRSVEGDATSGLAEQKTDFESTPTADASEGQRQVKKKKKKSKKE